MPTDPTTPTTALLTEASVAFLLEHRTFSGCLMASLTIRERLEAIEAQARADERRRLAGLVEGLERDRTGLLVARAAVLAVFDTEPAP